MGELAWESPLLMTEVFESWMFWHGKSVQALEAVECREQTSTAVLGGSFL